MAAPKSSALAGDDVGACVIDCGSWLVRAGPAGDDAPRALHAPALGMCAAPEGSGPVRRVAGDPAVLAPRGVVVADVRAVHRYDARTGAAAVEDWDAMQEVWAAAAAAAGVADLGAAPLLLVEPTRRWTRGDPDRAAALERAFEGIGVPAAYVARGAATAAFASVRTTACVVDVGHQGAIAVPVVDGYALHKASVSSSVGGQYLSDALYGVLDEMLAKKQEKAASAPGTSVSDATGIPDSATWSNDSRVPIGSLQSKLRALHEVRRRRKPPSPALANVDPDLRLYDVEDLALQEPLRSVTDQHRAFYRMRLIDDIKASVFRVSVGAQATQPKAGPNTSGGIGAMGDESNDVAMSDANNESNGNGTGADKPESSNAGPRDSSDGLGQAAGGTNGDKESRDGEKDREREIEKAKERGRPALGTTSYELPDGNVVDIASSGAAPIADAMFLNGQAEDPFRRAISNMAFDAITTCDIDMRREMFSGIVLTGGCTLIPGAVERFTREMAVLTPQLFKMKIIAAQSSIQRTGGPWIGGSIVASLGTFQQAWVSKAEYDELGAMGSLRKCP